MVNIMGDIMSITQSKADTMSRGAHRKAPLLPVVMTGIAGLALLVFGMPQLVAGMLVAGDRNILWDLARQRPIAGKDLAAAVAAREAADRWMPTADQEAERGLLLIRQAEEAAEASERDRLFAAAAEAIGRSLSRGPVQPHGWAVLAVLRERAGNRQGAADALRLSLLSGAFDPDLMAWRLKIGMRLLPVLSEEGRDLLAGQIRKLWVMSPDEIARLGGGDEGTALIRQALSGLSASEIATYVRRIGVR